MEQKLKFTGSAMNKVRHFVRKIGPAPVADIADTTGLTLEEVNLVVYDRYPHLFVKEDQEGGLDVISLRVFKDNPKLDGLMRCTHVEPTCLHCNHAMSHRDLSGEIVQRVCCTSCGKYNIITVRSDGYQIRKND